MIHSLRPQQNPDVPHEAATRERLATAAINAPRVQEPPRMDPRLPQPVELGEDTDSKARIRVFSSGKPEALPRPAPGDGLRLMPLEGFFWSGPLLGRHEGLACAAAPRVRGDHVIILVTEGGCSIDLPKKRHLVSAGRIAFIPAGTAFSTKPPPGVRGWALLVPVQLAQGLPDPLPHGFRCGFPNPADRPLLEPAIVSLGQGSPRSSIETKATAFQIGLLTLALSRIVGVPEVQDSHARRLDEARQLTERFLSVAAENLAQGWTIAELAGKLECTVAHLDQSCHDSRGRSALELLYDLRLQRAAALLRGSDMSFEHIALELGYSGLGHFLRTFAASTGRTPESFRTDGHSAVLGD
ncbi:helix-turn-helix transcriptional regulator [Paracoccus sp. MBLB3053]|uniref:Helix-turn-helix transcriptional regulator n=1 Tax=Paracoccus aurantius TaxID=3073814 RepID=A0ABU2HSV4_9RHOB|nr:helix-turn-helix transcriptional regulator [Paracoccus sp. MBLB3053]MDS9468123.1 helix-turn-helix transcriptional regulator [Paracoccus sp. MBLB3053]